MALSIEEVLELPIRTFERSTKRVLFELSDGKKFYLLGGKDNRPLKLATAYFSPKELIMVVKAGLDEDTFRKLILMKEMGLAASIEEITKSELAQAR